MIGVDAQQRLVRADIVGRRMGVAESLQPRIPNEAERLRARQHVEQTPAGGLGVVAFERGLHGCRDALADLDSDSAFVGGLNVFTREGSEKPHNVTLVAGASQVIELDKCSLSSDDRHHGVQRGPTFYVFLPEGDDAESVRWAVLNCHEYTHVDLVRTLLDHRIELLVVVTTHAATRLYWEYATADIHRLFCYVVIANIAELGGSGVFAPFRRIGREYNAQIGSAGQVFGARGPARFSVEHDLEIGELRSLRGEFADRGFNADAAREERVEQLAAQHSSIAAAHTPQLVVEPVVPSEHFVHTLDRPAGRPPTTGTHEVPHRFVAGTLRVAVGQLASMPVAAYIDYRYRLRKHPAVQQFQDGLDAHLNELEQRCRRRGVSESGHLLDMLVLPEVFVPRDYVTTLQTFSDRMGTTVVAGVDYPGETEEQNANECLILRPGLEPVTYRKVTRSQYDAHADHSGGRMKMARGDAMLRFVDDSSGFSFGVLICYDFSHVDLMHQLNLSDRAEPLELVVVAAHNPFGDLYRSCCIADSHRYYQYIVMCNVTAYGGSGVFGPLRTPGARQTLMEMGKGVDTITLTDLDLKSIRAARGATDERLNDVRESNPLHKFMRRPGVFQARV
ncbi:MAG: hypothetical protein IPL75_03260 [Acidobacteria bacterium]|nr:hypothetical protein [Acidobacteriota bacterium]